jgi:acyl carrier protein
VETTREEVREFIAKGSDRLAGIADGESLLEAGILDSLGVLELVGFLEERYGIRVGDDEMMPENFGSIDAIVEFVRQRRAALEV